MTRHSELQFESEGRTLRAYLAWPEMTTGAAPGVLVLHEAFGLNDDIRLVTDRLAQAGYVALAADLFAGQNRALCMARLMGGLFLDSLDHQGVRDTRRALDVLAALPGVDAGRLGAVGFCLGGSLALATACTDGRLRAIAPYYGFNPRPLEAVRRSCPVVGSYPERDPTTGQGRQLEAELSAAGTAHDIKVYPGTLHSFANQGPAFDPVASVDAWNRVLGFFDAHVRGESTGTPGRAT